MISTLSKDEVLTGFPPDYFDYIVIDEFHHAGAATYRKVLDYFRPDFLLGLTATPERMDGRDVLQLCDYNIAHEIRLFEAIEKELLVPFYYFAIYDDVDYSAIQWHGTGYNNFDLEKLLASDTRANLVLNNLRKFLPAGGAKTKALGFCVNTGHALFMQESFEAFGVSTAVVLGNTPEDERTRIIARLTDEDDPLEVVFSVDVFTEGVDIPELTHILLLRPTESFTVFQQQIGRGLRRHSGKDFVVILDFIGNYRSSFIPYLSLRGISSARKIDLSRLPEMPKVPSICYVDENREVTKIQRRKLREILGTKADYYLEIYRQIRREIDKPLDLMEFFDHPAVDELNPFFRYIGKNWLRIKEAAGDLTEYEQALLGGAGEALLQHIENELNPAKSYKMVVLSSLVEKEADTEGWGIDEIARDFKNFYLQNRRYLADYTDMARTSTPEEYPISKVRSHLLKMPLKYLADKEHKFFHLDTVEGKFFLKKGENGVNHRLWNQPDFKDQLRDRITFALKTYFYRKEKQVIIR